MLHKCKQRRRAYTVCIYVINSSCMVSESAKTQARGLAIVGTRRSLAPVRQLAFIASMQLELIRLSLQAHNGIGQVSLIKSNPVGTRLGWSSDV